MSPTLSLCNALALRGCVGVSWPLSVSVASIRSLSDLGQENWQAAHLVYATLIMQLLGGRCDVWRCTILHENSVPQAILRVLRYPVHKMIHPREHLLSIDFSSQLIPLLLQYYYRSLSKHRNAWIVQEA